jgi:hypothetical protein
MRVLLDNEQLTIDRPSVALALDAARGEAIRRGRIVIEATADGAQISDDLLTSPPDDDGGLAEIRFVTVESGPFISVTLSDAADALAETATAHHEAARLLDQGEEAQASGQLQGVLATWAMASDVVQKAGLLLGIDPGSVAVTTEAGPTDGAACIEGLRARFEEVRDAVKDGDWAAVSDVLGHDLDQELERWTALMRALGDRAQIG